MVREVARLLLSALQGQPFTVDGQSPLNRPEIVQYLQTLYGEGWRERERGGGGGERKGGGGEKGRGGEREKEGEEREREGEGERKGGGERREGVGERKGREG